MSRNGNTPFKFRVSPLTWSSFAGDDGLCLQSGCEAEFVLRLQHGQHLA